MIKLINDNNEDSELIYQARTKLRLIHMGLWAKFELDFDFRRAIIQVISLLENELNTNPSKYLIARNILNIINELQEPKK